MDRIAVIDTESRRFAEAVGGCEPDRPCPTCPDWTAADLLWHLTEVHLFWGTILADGVRDDAELASVEAAKPARPQSISELLELREQATSVLLRQLAARDDAEPCWSWWPPDQSVGFTRRMQTYEATMHRVDAELTAGLPVGPIADDVASGAVDHAVDVMWGWMPEGASYRADCVVEFRSTDSGERWLVEVGEWAGPDGAIAPRAVRAGATAEPTATATAPVADLALWAWTRGGTVRTSGTPTSVAALEKVIRGGMP